MQKKKIIREKLKELIPGEKYKFFATFSRFGIDKRFRDKETVLLLDVYVEINEIMVLNQLEMLIP